MKARMRIAIAYAKESSARKWRDAVAAALPESQVDIWQPGYDQLVDYAIGWWPPAELFTTQPQLRAFFSTGAGVEHVIHNPAVPAGLPVIRIEDAGMGQLMVDYCRYEVLRWLQQRDRYAAQQADHVWEPHTAFDRSEWPIGVFGLGALGRHVAAAFAADGFPVNAYSRSASHDEPNVKMFSEAKGAEQFGAFMNATRVLIILAPLTPDTQDKFDRKALQSLRPSSHVINVARGGLLVDDAVLALLDSSHLAGVALDVFREEPLPRDHPYWKHPKVRITPHVAATTPVGPATAQIVEKIHRLTRGENVSGIVERQRGY
jgi:glyoxylate/hydroxypyruvate reductase A